MPFVEAFFLTFFFFGQKSGVYSCVNWIFDSVPFDNLSVFMPMQGCFHYHSSIIDLYVRDGDALESFFIVKNYLVILDALFLHMKSSNVLSMSVKNCVGILIGISLIK